ncbi:hypothetical protein [Reticulibacter mediterranei]|uniref:hypothetical protein n=1 Tax=Reticulibacter mediterranei TaxID=2778369 RepID=UPI001C692F43|nr:hypothetical protein [Reticulibacter mediterranei]
MYSLFRGLIHTLGVSWLPVRQVGKHHQIPLEKGVEPTTKVVQTDLGRQAGLKAGKAVWLLTAEAKDVVQSVVDTLNGCVAKIGKR